MTVHDLLLQALPSEGANVEVLIPSSESSPTPNGEARDDIDDHGVFAPVVQDDAARELPVIDDSYFDRVEATVRDLCDSPLYVVPPLQAFRTLPGDLKSVVRERCGGGVDLAVATMLAVLKALPEGGQAAFVLPSKFAASHRTQRVKDQVLHAAHPELFLECSGRVLESNGRLGSRAQIILFARNESETDPSPVTRFFSVPDSAPNGLTDRVRDDFSTLLRQGGGETEFGYVIREPLDPAEAWTFAAHDPEIEREVQELEELGEVTPLGDLFEITRGIKTGPAEANREGQNVDDQSTEGTLFVLDQSGIRRDGTIVVEDARPVSPSDAPELDMGPQQVISGLREGDICVRQRVDEQGLIAGRVESDYPSTTVSSKVFLLRPRDGVTLEDTEVVLQYLQSDRASRYLTSRYVGGPGGDGRLLKSSLKKLPVPKADADLRSALRSLTEAADRFDAWKAESLDAARSLFDFSTAGDGKMHVLSTGRRSRQRQRAAERQDDLSYRVQTQFPHPVAYRWRTVAAAKPDLEGYLHVLECAEVLTCYLALVAITMARAVGEKIGYLKVLGDRVADGRGTNLGDWIAILREVRDSRSFRHLPDDTPFYEVMHFMPEVGCADEALSSLKSRRDKQAHGKGPRGDAVEPAFEEAKEDLLDLLDAAEFLSEYPLRYIDRTKADTIQCRLAYWYRDVMGDHPLVPVESETTEPKTLEAESLYLVDRSGTLHLLRPLLDRRRCPVCGTWSTFYLDSYEEDEHACVMKSMEHSHTTTDEEIYEAFQKIGLLP